MSQAPKPPNPFDPVEEAPKTNQPDLLEEKQISQMVNESGYEPPISEKIREALEAFDWLNKGGEAPHLVIETDGNHGTAQWVNPRKKP